MLDNTKKRKKKESSRSLTLANNLLGDLTDGWGVKATNASAGFADAMTAGLTKKVREATGCNDVVFSDN